MADPAGTAGADGRQDAASGHWEAMIETVLAEGKNLMDNGVYSKGMAVILDVSALQQSHRRSHHWSVTELICQFAQGCQHVQMQSRRQWKAAPPQG